MKNKILIGIIIFVSILLVGSVVLTKLGIIDQGEAQAAEEKTVEKIHSVEELKDGSIYIWKNCEGKKITDANNDFILCPEGNTNLDFDDRMVSEANYTVWIDSSEDHLIPTLTRADKLIYVSKEGVPDTYDFLRMYENGYSIGITSLQPDAGGHYYVNYMVTDEKDYKQYINTESDAGDLSGLGVLKLYLDKVGQAPIGADNISDSGIVKGLTKDEQYVCEFYTGTYYQDYMLTADQHTFTEFEDFECHGYEFLHSNCISVDIPDWLCSGYYYLNGEALFRFVDDEDLSNYNGKSFDENIAWNEPLIKYNNFGQVVFDPSKDEDDEFEDGENAGDAGLEAAGAPVSASGSVANWGYSITGTDPFCAVINIAPMENGEVAVLTLTDPEGNVTTYEEAENKITVNLENPIEGEYKFNLSKIPGRSFVVLYSNGETYFGEGDSEPEVSEEEVATEAE